MHCETRFESSLRIITWSGTIKGLENRLIVPLELIGTGTAVVQKRERLGGLLNYYYREAA